MDDMIIDNTVLTTWVSHLYCRMPLMQY